MMMDSERRYGLLRVIRIRCLNLGLFLWVIGMRTRAQSTGLLQDRRLSHVTPTPNGP